MMWIPSLMTFNFTIRYKKGITNKLAYISSRPPVKALLVASCIQPLVPTEYKESYTSYVDFIMVCEHVKVVIKGSLCYLLVSYIRLHHYLF